MHVPNPLGSFPLTLRQQDVRNPRNGELLFDYEENYLYYINKESGEKIGIADSIYKKLLEMKLENTRINIVQSDDKGEEPISPEIIDRKMNNFYFNIINRTPKKDTEGE